MNELKLNKENILLNIPSVKNDLIQLFVHDKFISNLTNNELNAYRIQIVNYIYETDDISILNDFYFVGHKTDRGNMSNELIKITMDKNGKLSDLPYECGHIYRDMLYIMTKQRYNKFIEMKNNILNNINHKIGLL
jgi:hypothetical protein